MVESGNGGGGLFPPAPRGVSYSSSRAPRKGVADCDRPGHPNPILQQCARSAARERPGPAGTDLVLGRVRLAPPTPQHPGGSRRNPAWLRDGLLRPAGFLMAESPVQSGPIQSQQAGGADLVAVAGAQDRLDVALLEFAQGPCSWRRRSRGSGSGCRSPGDRHRHPDTGLGPRSAGRQRARAFSSWRPLPGQFWHSSRATASSLSSKSRPW